MDLEIKAEFCVNVGDDSEMSVDANRSEQVDIVGEDNNSITEEKAPSISTLAGSESSLIQGEVTASKAEGLVHKKSYRGTDKGRKSLALSDKPSSKRKMKVDWAPDLHKQFVQAVEQLGVDKAVPSKILELMGTECLTRHNVASHLQKYRSHRKHMLAREAEAASWRSRRQISADQSLAYMWLGHIPSSPSRPPWAPPPVQYQPPGGPSFWYFHHQDVLAPGMPCYPRHYPLMRCTAPLTIGVPVAPNVQPLLQRPFDFDPRSKESIDAVIGEVLSRPWLPLPLGLKPPAIDSVILELQRQGISKIPLIGGLRDIQ